MRPRPTPAPPATTDELLILLRRTRLLDDEQLRRLGDAWNGDDDPQPHVTELVRVGLLTRYQGEQLLAGRPGRLRLGPYRLLDRLGRGGAGQVFKAEHLLLRRLVALKVLGRARRVKRVPVRKTVAGQTPVRSCRPTQLRREAEVAGQLSHPNIVAAHDACWLRGRLVLVLEYVEGVDLDRLVTETGPMPVSLAVETIRQSALALGYLHEHRLVHRDVKPANLILTPAASLGGVPVVKLLDLGLASPSASAGEELCGTPDYLAPERGQSAASTDIRSDLYSLGCTAYFVLAGRPPFPGGNWTGKLLRHRIEVPTPISDLRPDVPAGVAAVVERLMARDPDHRFATPAEAVAAIESLSSVEQATSLAPVEARASEAACSTSRRPTILAALCLAAVGLGIGAGSVAHSSFASTDAKGPTKPAARVPLTESAVSSLPAAISAAEDGAVIEVPAGRHILSPIHILGKRLTLRGVRGARPTLVRATQNTWDALIQSDRDLVLEGLDLHGGETEGPATPLVCVERGTLSVRACRLTQRCQAPALALRRGARLSLDNSRVMALAQGVAVEAPSQAACSVLVKDSGVELRDLTGPAVLLWATESESTGEIEVQLTGSKLRAGRIVACRSLTALVRLRADGNHLIFHQALASFDGYRDPQSWQTRLSWHGGRNRCETTGPWLRLDGRPGPAWNEQAFAKLWSGRR